MIIDKSEQELRKIVDDWADAYFKGEIYGFGLSDEMGFTTFFEQDMGCVEPESEGDDNLHELGFRADTHRTGVRVGRGFRVKAVFDNNPAIQKTVRRGYEILDPEDIPKMGKIKIAIFPRRYYEIKKQLEGYGLVEYEDFIYYNAFVALYNYFVQDKVLIWKATVAVTTRCTLNCEHCNMFMPHYKNPADLPLEELLSDLETLFSRVDYVQWFGILGGEPLLYKKLPEYLEGVKNFSGRIGEFIIDTNGSVVPSDKVLQSASELGNVRFMINNYETDQQYYSLHNQMLEKVKNSGVSYTLRNYDWSQYRRLEEIEDSEELRRHYIRCNQPFTAFQNGRFYTCHLPWSAARCGISTFDPLDSLDFADSAVSDLDIVKSGLGHIERGYTSNCAMCNGCDYRYYEKIPKAVQLRRGKGGTRS